jgi:hypothetical protein
MKQNCSPRRELSNNMLHATYTWGNRSDSWLLVVEKEIVNLTLGPSFGHNLCFRCPNGSCEPILDIYVLRALQWYKELFNPLSFDSCNRSLKIWESTEIPTPKVEVPLEVWGFISSHFLTLLGACGVTPRFPSWPTTLQAFVLLASPKLGLQQALFTKSKAKTTSLPRSYNYQRNTLDHKGENSNEDGKIAILILHKGNQFV